MTLWETHCNEWLRLVSYDELLQVALGVVEAGDTDETGGDHTERRENLLWLLSRGARGRDWGCGAALAQETRSWKTAYGPAPKPLSAEGFRTLPSPPVPAVECAGGCGTTAALQLGWLCVHCVEGAAVLNRKAVRTLRAGIEAALSSNADDVCWLDIYRDLGKLVGRDFKPALLPRDKFLANCARYIDALKADQPYERDEVSEVNVRLRVQLDKLEKARDEALKRAAEMQKEWMYWKATMSSDDAIDTITYLEAQLKAARDLSERRRKALEPFAETYRRGMMFGQTMIWRVGDDQSKCFEEAKAAHDAEEA